MTIFSTGVRISTLFATSLMTFGVQVPFFPVLLADRGLGEKEIALIVAAPMVLRVTTVSGLGAYADRVGDRRRVLVAYSGLALLGCLLLGPAQGFWALLAATLAMALFANACLPLVDASATSAARRGEAVYGPLRAWGSSAYILANLVAGWAIGVWGTSVVYPLLLAAYVLQFVSAPLAPRDAPATPVEGPRPSLWSGVAELLADRRLTIILIGVALIQASHAMLYGFGSLYWASIGFTGGEMGVLWAVSVVGEVILFAVADRVIARIGARGLLFIGGAGAVLRWCLFPFLGDSAAAWGLLQLMHAASFAATHLGTMHVVTHAVGDHRAATAQGLAVTFTGLGMALATLASGTLYARFGGVGFLGMAGVAAAGTLVLVVLLARREA